MPTVKRQDLTAGLEPSLASWPLWRRRKRHTASRRVEQIWGITHEQLASYRWHFLVTPPNLRLQWLGCQQTIDPGSDPQLKDWTKFDCLTNPDNNISWSPPPPAPRRPWAKFAKQISFHRASREVRNCVQAAWSFTDVPSPKELET